MGSWPMARKRYGSNCSTVTCTLTEQPKWPLIGAVHIVVVQCSTSFFIIWFCISGQRLESLGTIPLTYDSLLILSKQLTMKYTV